VNRHRLPQKIRRSCAWCLLAARDALRLLSPARPTGFATATLLAVSPNRFRSRTKDAGVAFVLENSPTEQKHLIETMLGGVAVFGYNGDHLTTQFSNDISYTIC